LPLWKRVLRQGSVYELGVLKDRLFGHTSSWFRKFRGDVGWQGSRAEENIIDGVGSNQPFLGGQKFDA
jgi:hypothetical protein